MKYFVYCLYKDDQIIYIGSSTKLVNRVIAHNKDKDFDSVVYCRLPDKQTMLNFEIYAIDKVKPPLNKIFPTPTISDKPEGITWKKVNLTFLSKDRVDFEYILAINISWGYRKMICDYFNITNIDPYGENLSYFKFNGKVVAVFDGSGVSLEELAVSEGLISLDEYELIRYQEEGAIRVKDYEKSLTQFD